MLSLEIPKVQLILLNLCMAGMGLEERRLANVNLRQALNVAGQKAEITADVTQVQRAIGTIDSRKGLFTPQLGSQCFRNDRGQI